MEDTEAGNPRTDVGVEVRSTMREHRGQGQNEEHIMQSHKDLRKSSYSEVNIDAWIEPTKEERSDRGHRPGGLLRPAGEEGLSVEYGGSDGADSSETRGGDGGS